MSLINQMLRDLEERRGRATRPAPSDQAITGLRSVSGTRGPRGLARVLGLVLCLTGLVLTAGVRAEGDPEAGKSKALPCMGCHGIPGYFNVYPSYRVPKLGGQHQAYIVAALQAYKNGQRSHKTMIAQATTLNDQDMQDIAAYFASLSSGGK